ncbi:trifunctional serine/threonine-protein kinase/ATP-binding protein/sensor histidine kinase [Argonema galeatum]|uniref:trifunctional serine/threonine-protein kinase/ATP-binding protein/sensor histidine kinase n=1 Tax=Argonema galeatum TaxID=2942762 RepID=UPI002012B062|nr:ATP-binding sensor histidine kinase [Argonema galeatum]MCL1465135.1 AAA family ATPase [Argonema galeatum A003/A1]
MSTAVDLTNRISGYHLVEQLYCGSRTLVYRAIRETDQLPVVIKLLNRDYPSFSELLQFRNQYTIAKNLGLPGVVEPYNLESYRHSYALVMEDFGGISLRDYAQEASLTLAEILEIAIQITEVLDGLYRNRVIHKDIKPANILIHPKTQQVKLIDFSIASLLPRETQEIQNPNVLEGTLAYISPEQTGRMNRGIDYRTDFYSLGATFYELLTGKLPFECDDPMELVHCHIAKQPPAINSQEIPQVISDIVMKLMAKNAEKRYQSAWGLKQDLEKCLQQCQETGKIERFELGTRDICDRFLIPEKLYGRETEVQTLLNAFERVANGTSELMLVAGFSGIGKTAVVNEVHKPIVRQRGYFIKGKFDQFNRNIPFSALVLAFRDFMAQLLSESDAQIHEWKTKILEAIGDNGQVIIEVIPELERIIGQQPPAPELSGIAAQNLFNLLFHKFIAVFTTKEHPLVIFLDDLQWADSASLKLMQMLVNESQLGYLLLLGAYRDNEVSPSHPLMLTLDEVRKAGTTLNTITLVPLGQISLNQLVADTLVCDPKLAQPLTELVYQKTQGNPFFATQFLKALHQDELITFDIQQSGHWQCDISKVRKAALTDNVVEFMAQQLQKLSIETQEVLKLAACIGNQFDLATLAIVSESSETETATALWKALQEGLVLPQSEVYKFYVGIEPNISEATSQTVAYRFLHDRVQQAAYSLIATDQKQATHLKIGQRLLEKTPIQGREEQIFAIVNQLNIGLELISQPAELEELARLNLMAGRKAKASTAYVAAVKYLSTAMDLLSSDRWQSQYNLTLEIVVETAEAEYLNTNFAAANTLVEMVLQHGKTLIDRIPAYEIKIQVHMAQHQVNDAIDTGLQALEMLGYPVNLSEQDFLVDLPTLESLEDYPTMTNPAQLAAMRILKVSFTPVLVGRPQILLPVIVRQVKLCVEGGHSPLASATYAWYGTLLCGPLGNIDIGYQAGRLALQLLKHFETKEHKVVTYNMFYTFVHHWKEPLRESLSPLAEGVQIGLESGNYEYTGYCITNYCFYIFLAGQNLETVESEHKKYHELLLYLKWEHSISISQIWYQLLLNLLGKAVNPLQLIGEKFDESTMLSQLLEQNDLIALFHAFLAKTILFYLLEEFEPAVESAAKAASYSSVGSENFVNLHFYQSLALLANYSNVCSEERSHYLSQIDANQEKMQLWMQHAPMNYEHKYHLVAAEKHRVFNQKTEAIEFYDRAIKGAKENEYLQDEALANELAAKFYLDWGKEKVAASYMQDAYYCYARWGAKAKIEDLEQRYPQLLQPILNQPKLRFNPLETLGTISQSSYTSSSSSTSISDALDFASIVQAAQALSSKIQIDELLGTLNQIILQTSGAETCALLLPDRDEWQIRAITHINPDNELPTTLLQTQPLDGSVAIPLKLIYYVKHTLQTVVIEGGKTEIPGLMNDCILQYQSQSMLCTPIVDRGNLVGILYLEHRSTKGVFTGDRLLVLNFLCTQAAISLENARLYQQAQDYAHQVEQSQLQLVQSEKMSALGNLVAGVAHEINNPVGFISGNIHEAIAAVKDLTEYLQLYQEKFPNPGYEIEEKAEEFDIEYLVEDLPKMLNSMQVGCDRIQGISTSLRTFSRADKDYKVPFNIHDGIDSTILILKHRLKANEQRPAIEVVKEYGNLPSVECFPGQLNQVFMNILANAIDALEESNREQSFEKIKAQANCITIRTEIKSSEWVAIRISDNGPGISDEIKANIFDHLFTTKGVGKGTGLGLAIARQIVVEKHGGTIKVNSVLGEGTEFAIALPAPT